MSTAVPAILGGRYEIGALLGRGGMAEVHVGKDVRLGRTVAVKMLRPDMARDPSFQVRFRREAHSAASLNHPSVVAVYDTGEDTFDGNPVPYIVMEYVDGSTLRELLSSGSRLVPERALEILDGVLNALAYSHQQGIVHRDIKPGNVMLTRDGQVKVMDFGIARAVADAGATMTQTSAVIGTAQYLSPEQARGEQVDARSDLYSAGCLLYELLTGRPPFIGDSPLSLAYQHVGEAPVPPSELDPDLPPGIDAVVLKALTKDRAARYQTASAMRADIASVLAGRPVAAPPAAALQPVEQTSMMPGLGAGAGSAATTIGPSVTSRRDYYDDDRPREGRAGRGLAYTLLALAVISLFIIAGVFGRELLLNGAATEASVPNLSGMTVQKAKAALQDEGLRLGRREQAPSAEVPKGRISDQDPGPGITLEQGDRVNVTVSTGAEMVEVPDLAGFSVTDAIGVLRDFGLRVGDRKPKPSDQEADTVIRSDPGPGEEVERGSEVRLVIASGNNRVPDLAGRTEAEARQLLSAAGFQVGSVEEVQTDEAPAGTVIGQSQAAGAGLPLDSPIDFKVAIPVPDEVEPTEAPTEVPPTETPPPTETTPPPA